MLLTRRAVRWSSYLGNTRTAFIVMDVTLREQKSRGVIRMAADNWVILHVSK